MRAVVRLDHHQEVPDQLLIRNHNGPACIARVHIIRTWLDVGQELDWGDYDYGNAPGVHAAPHYHPVGNPPTQLPPNPENLVATVLEWENTIPTPPLRPVHTRRATPYPVRPVPVTPPLLCLPWYGIGGVPPLVTAGFGVEEDGEAAKDLPEEAAEHEQDVGGDKEPEDVVREKEVAEEDETVKAVAEEVSDVVKDMTEDLAALGIAAPLELTAGDSAGAEHPSRAQKRRARRKRTKNSAYKLRRSQRLQEKEEAGFEMPEDKSARVQSAKFDFTACGATEEECAGIVGEAAVPPANN